MYDTGSDGDRSFLVMELVAGPDLAAVLREQGPLAPDRVAQLGAQTARALAAAHAAGVVHREVKPSNLLLTADGTVKLTDFGIAGAVDTPARGDAASQPRGTAVSGPVVGAGAYVSPEQASGHPASPATDLYGLGCVLYELLTGRPPFVADDPAVLLRRHAEEAPVPPSQIRPDVPPELEQAVLRLLIKNPAERPADAGHIASVLESINGTAPRDAHAAAERMNTTRVLPILNPATPGHGGQQPLHGPATPPASQGWQRVLARLGERPLLAATGAMVILAAVIAIAAVATSGGDPRATSPDTTGAIPAAEPASQPTQPTPLPTKVSETPTNRQPQPGPGALLTALQQRLNQQADSGQLDPKVARDIRDHIAEITRRLRAGKTQDAVNKLAEIRKRLADAAQQGEWTPDASVTLLLDQLSNTL